MVPARQGAAGDARVQQRLQAPARPAGERLDVQSEALLGGADVDQAGPVVGFEGDHQRPALAVPGIGAGGRLHVSDVAGVGLGGVQTQPEQGLLAVVQLADRRQHARGCAGSPRAGGRVDEHHPQTPLRGAPSAGRADDTPAEHADVRVLTAVVGGCHQPPFAGMTRSRFDGRRERSPSQPAPGLPWCSSLGPAAGLPPAAARSLLGSDVLIGRSTHSAEQLDAALADPDVDYACVGPTWATPTKPGRPAAGLELVRRAAAVAGDRPWFAIGGIDLTTVDTVVEAGARRIVVVRALTEADDPATATAALLRQLPPLSTARVPRR